MKNKSKWERFVEQLDFKGMSEDNKKVINIIAKNTNTLGCILTYSEISRDLGITKSSARKSVKKLEFLGIIETVREDSLPLIFYLNADWKEF